MIHLHPRHSPQSKLHPIWIHFNLTFIHFHQNLIQLHSSFSFAFLQDSWTTFESKLNPSFQDSFTLIQVSSNMHSPSSNLHPFQSNPQSKFPRCNHPHPTFIHIDPPFIHPSLTAMVVVVLQWTSLRLSDWVHQHIKLAYTLYFGWSIYHLQIT